VLVYELNDVTDTIRGILMFSHVAVTCCLLLILRAGAYADPGGTGSSSIHPAASREKLGSTLDLSTITEQEADLPVIGLEIEQEPNASEEEQATRLNEYLFVLAAYVDLKKLAIKGVPFIVSGQVVTGDPTAAGSWAVAELVTSKAPPKLKIIPPFIVRTLPKYRAFSAVCKGPVDELDACISSAMTEIRAKGEDPLSSPRVEIIKEGDVPEHAETRITLPVRATTAGSQNTGTGSSSPPATTAPNSAPRGNVSEQQPSAPHTEKVK
jgi:hypothetical protein